MLTMLATSAALIVNTPHRAQCTHVRAPSPELNFFSQMVTKLQAGSYDEVEVRANVQRMIDRKVIFLKCKQ